VPAWKTTETNPPAIASLLLVSYPNGESINSVAPEKTLWQHHSGPNVRLT